MSIHAHDRVELAYVVSGSCHSPVYECTYDLQSQKTVVTAVHDEKLEPGQFILMDAGVVHGLEVTAQCYMLNVELRFEPEGRHLYSIGDLAGRSAQLRNCIIKGKTYLRGVDRFNKLQQALNDVIEHTSSHELRIGDDDALADILVARLLLITAECLDENVAQQNIVNYVAKIDRYVSANLESEISEDDLARVLGISKNYMQRIFRAYKGMPLKKYINWLRIEKSKRLLASYGEYDIMDVVIACGFNSRQHFSRVFREKTGMTPTQFRQEFFKTHQIRYYPGIEREKKDVKT